MHVQLSTLRLALATALLLGSASGNASAAPPPEEPSSAGRHEDHAGQSAHGAAPGAARIPESLKVEHAEIHEALVRATKLRGAVGDAARGLAKVLHPHFVREEEIALPPLGLLAPLARGKPTPEMRPVLELTDALRAELPKMLEEHVAIAAAARNLEKVARAGKNREVEQLAQKLQLHARSEEEVFYPAAILVGDVVRSGLASDAHGTR